MPDRKPPRLAGDVFVTLRALLDFQRESLVRKVEGITADQAAWSPVPSGTSLLWLVRHLAAAERTWVLERFAGLGPGRTTGPPTTSSPLTEAVEVYRTTWVEVDAVIDAAGGPEAPCRAEDGDPSVDLGWVVAHLVEGTARHAGHADLIREMIDGSTGR